ncbi:uncharacterized protein [Arachis hypogaea]|nr:uncharacterized protein LOC112769786 [Arachis hypogaea]
MDPLVSVIFFLFTFLSIKFASSASELSYNNHCNSFVSYSTPSNKRVNTFPLGDTHNGYFQGGKKITGLGNGKTWSQFSFYLQPRRIQTTEASHLFKLEGLVSFRSTLTWNFTYVQSRSHRWRRIGHGSDLVTSFKLEGFWSESSGKVCMVGRGTYFSEIGESIGLEAVFKLNNVFSSSNISSMVIGKLESLSSENDKSYFEPISLFMFPKEAYDYTLDSTEADKECSSGIDAAQGLSLDSNSLSFCSNSISRAIAMLPLEYSDECNSPKNCTPIDGSSGQLPTLMSLKAIQCSHSQKHRMRVLLEFSNNSYYYYGMNQEKNPQNILVGEGWWNKKSNVLCVVACHIKEISSSVDGARVDDCSVRLRLRFPSTWSIKNTSSIVGEIWSNKTANEQGYFKRIKFRNDEPQLMVVGHGLEYKYSQLEIANKSCHNQKPVKGQGKSYPEAYSYDMRFDMSVKESRKRVAWGYSAPLFVADQFYDLGMPMFLDSVSSFSDPVPHPDIHNNNNGSLFNISYKISLTPLSFSGIDDKNSFFSNKSFETVKLTAEGIYDAQGGTLCMVGCRKVSLKNATNTYSLDCEIMVNFQFPPLGTTDGRRIRGSIESTRKKSDPLYFKPLDLSASTNYMISLRRNAWRMDMEVIIALISTTLACVFVGLQLYHVRRNPDVLPFISIMMMSILTFGYMIPLVLNLEALLSQNPNNKNIVYGFGGWLEVNEIAVRLTTMVAFLLQFRLLYLTWSSRKTNGSKGSFWNAEKKATFVTLPLFAAGLLVVFLFKLKKGRAQASIYAGGYYNREPSSWENLKSYGGLVMDGFLLPQIILNIFSNIKRAQILSCSFYIGTTFVRVLPHAYDLYRAHNYAEVDDFAYLYADPDADFYSTTWDIVIPLGGILFAIIVYLQQRFDALCVMPQRFKGSFAYDKVPAETELEGEVQTTNI